MSMTDDLILKSKILIVEDDFLGLTVLKEVFKKYGFEHIEEAADGEEALKKVKSFRPDLIILDVIMPKMDGVECCKRIRSDPNPQIANVPILFQTALDGAANKTRFFGAGATDYITKPVDWHEIIARSTVHLERNVMTRHLLDFKVRVAHELETARATQRVLIPNDKTIMEMENDYNLQICHHYQPCSEVGGDFWGMKSLSNDELAIYSVDFSGHGVNAALNAFRLHALMQATIDTSHVPGAYLTHINAILAPLLPTGQFATMFYGIINSKKRIFSYSSAAAPPPVIFHRRNRSFQTLSAGGTLLGIFKESTFDTSKVEFGAGDFLFLYSDALIETRNEEGYMLPIERWVETIQQNLRGNGCREAFSALLADFNTHCVPSLSDDLTLNGYFMND